MTEVPQRRLAIELRIAIDRAMRHESPRWVSAVRHLVRDNPHGVASSHVTHNLGVARRAWLARVVPTPDASLARWSFDPRRDYITPEEFREQEMGTMSLSYRVLESHYTEDGTYVIDKAELITGGTHGSQARDPRDEEDRDEEARPAR
jgi:hypothetical protein